MLSTALEVCGFACAVAGVFVLAGAGPALLAAAPCLLFMGFAAEGQPTKRPAWLRRPVWPQKLKRKPKEATT